MSDNKVVQFKKKNATHVNTSLPVEDVHPGALWASVATSLAESLTEYGDIPVLVEEAKFYDENTQSATWDFFPEEDTVYILTYDNIPVTLLCL